MKKLFFALASVSLLSCTTTSNVNTPPQLRTSDIAEQSRMLLDMVAELQGTNEINLRYLSHYYAIASEEEHFRAPHEFTENGRVYFSIPILTLCANADIPPGTAGLLWSVRESNPDSIFCIPGSYIRSTGNQFFLDFIVPAEGLLQKLREKKELKIEGGSALSFTGGAKSAYVSRRKYTRANEIALKTEALMDGKPLTRDSSAEGETLRRGAPSEQSRVKGRYSKNSLRDYAQFKLWDESKPRKIEERVRLGITKNYPRASEREKEEKVQEAVKVMENIEKEIKSMKSVDARSFFKSLALSHKPVQNQGGNK